MFVLTAAISIHNERPKGEPESMQKRVESGFPAVANSHVDRLNALREPTVPAVPH